MKKIKKIVIITVLLMNSISYIVARCLWRKNGEFGAKLMVSKPAQDDTMNYYIAGNVNQPDVAFKFMENELDGGITYVMYNGDRGCNMRLIAAQVIADIQKERYAKVRVIGISIGDLVGRYAEATCDNVETIAINPEPDPSYLQPWARNALRIGTPVLKALSVPLGWISQLPLAKGFSLSFLVDQWWEIVYRTDTPTTKDNVLGVICSFNDEFLDNQTIETEFSEKPIEYTNTKHGVTVTEAEEFARAFKRLQIGK